MWLYNCIPRMEMERRIFPSNGLWIWGFADHNPSYFPLFCMAVKVLSICVGWHSILISASLFEHRFDVAHHHHYYTPAPPKVEWWYTGFIPMSVRPSARPSLDKVSGTFWKKLLAQFISYPVFKPYEVSLLTFIHFRFPSLIFCPLVAKYLAGYGVSGTFWKNYWLNSLHTWHLPLWGEFYDPYTFRVPSLIFGCLVAKYLVENGVSALFEKKTQLAQFISYLALILMGWVSWPLYIFLFLSSFSALWWPNIWQKWGFRNLLKKLSAQFISYLAFILMGWVSWPLYIFVFLASFSALWWPNIWLKMGFPEFFLKDGNRYWILLDEVGSDQSGGILSPFMGTACYTPAQRSWRGVYWIHLVRPSVRLSVRPSVCL